MAHLIHLGIVQLTVAFSFMLIVASTIRMGQLEFASVVILSAVRCLVQLMILGIVLQTIFTIREPGLIAAYLLLMITLASREGFAKPKYYYSGLFTAIFVSFLVSTTTVGIFGGIFLVLQPEPFFDPQYVIPMVGMILGNGLTGLSLTMDLFLSHVDERQEHVELLLAFGAGPWAALRPGLRSSLKRGMIPTLNQMSVAGLVSIPGMMTGQVLGGSPPFQAALYQVFIFYVITTCTFAASLLATTFSVLALVDPRGRVRFERLQRGRRKGITDLATAPLALARSLLGGQAPPDPQGGSPSAKGAKGAGGSQSGSGLGAASNPCWLRPPTEPGPEPLLSFGCPALSRPGGRVLLRDVELCVCVGRATCVLGRSGTGKSSLLRALSDLVACDGTLALRGQPSTSFKASDWRREVRYCCTPKAPMEGTPRELIAALAGLGYPTLPDGVELLLCQWEMDLGLLDSPWSLLSTGEGQRMWLAVGIASKPAVLLLDEPTSALDERSRGLVEATLRGFLSTGSAVVLVTHDRQQAERLGDIWEVVDEAAAAGPISPDHVVLDAD